MLVFIDESGDPGFKVGRGSSPIFVTAMVIFLDERRAMATQDKIVALRQSLGINPEFKFNKCCDEHRDAFFNEINGGRFRVRAVVVAKNRIHSTALKTVKESFYKFFIRMMMKNDGGALRDAKVTIDGSGDRPFKRQFRAYLRKHIPAECVRKLELKDSIRDPLVQLADMAAGAIARSYRTDRNNPNRWRNMLTENGQIEDIWDFR